MFVAQEAHGPLLHWEIQRPERLNALGPTVGEEIANHLTRLTTRLREPHPTARLLYVTAASNPQGAWIAGGDLKELGALRHPREARRYARLLTNICEALAALPIPVVMGLDGKVIGGGLEFALAGDLRIATRETTLDFKQMAIGLATAFGGAQRLVNLVGLARAMEWQMLCATLTADEGCQGGLITRCVASREDAFAAALAWAHHFEALPFASVSTQKRMLVEDGRSIAKNTRDFSRLWRNPLHAKVLERFSPQREDAGE